MIKQQNKNDLRSQKTKNSIHMAFRTLMGVLPYEKITVKALTEEANINRKTFYLHYDTMDDLLRELRDLILSNGIRSIQAFEIPGELFQIIHMAFEYIDALPKIDFRILRCSFDRLGSYGFVEQLKKADLKFTGGFYENEPLKQHLALTFMSTCTMRFFYEWRYNCPHLTLTEAATLAHSFILHGISQSAAEQMA